MNRAESKYFHTAAKMDEAFIGLLTEKDFQYITVKEICQRAGVHRSTFYLHYETMADLLEESVESVMAEFDRRFQQGPPLPNLIDSPLEDLILIDAAHLLPYLTYIRENKRVFRTCVEQSAVLGLQNRYMKLFQQVFDPILARFQVPDKDRHYTMVFYLHGITALIMEWLKADCRESIEEIADIIIRNIIGPDRLKKERGE